MFNLVNRLMKVKFQYQALDLAVASLKLDEKLIRSQDTAYEQGIAVHN